MDFRKTFMHRAGKRSFYLVAVAAFVVAAVVGFSLLPTFNSVGKVSAQEVVISQADGAERATPEMLYYALNFKENLGDSLNAFNQLPCTKLDGGELGSKTFMPGVYCLDSARLAGELVLDGQNDPGAIFVFVVKGSLKAENGSTISLRNNAQAANAFFVTNEAATIGASSDFKGRIVANGNIKVEDGARVSGGKLMSVKGEINSAASATPDGGGTGTLEICKAQNVPPGGTSLANRIFNFTVSSIPGVVYQVPVGGCSGQIDVPAGPAVITELNTGQTLTGGSFTGNFQLIAVNQVSTNPGGSSLGTVNLTARTANINIVEGGVTSQLTLTFVNQFAITGFIEICKRAAAVPQPAIFALDPDVTGFFTFNVEGNFTTNQANPGVRVLQNYLAPVGGCTGPIAVTISNPPPAGSPASSTVRVSELGRPGVFLESVDTVPANREVAQEVLNARVNENGAVVANPGGGYATVQVFEGATAANETLINFRNRTRARVKVCKIAGPGIPANTPFTFTVTGTGFGATPGTFVAVTRTFQVLAGPASQGGFCNFVPGSDNVGIQDFVTGTDVTVNEVAPLTIGGLQVRTSVIRTTPAAGTAPIANLTPTATRVSQVLAATRSEVIEFEFVNFIFNPTTLKVCKIAGPGVALGTNFTFDVTFQQPTPASPLGPLFPNQAVTVTVPAGPASQGGFCTEVNAAAGNTPFIGGFLNAGSTVRVAERTTTPASTVTAINSSTSPTTTVCPAPNTSGGGLLVDLAGRAGTFCGNNGLQAGVTINVINFTNTSGGTTTPPANRAPFDFDGDGKSDVAVFRAGNWYSYNPELGSRTANFGLATDKLVPADYNGDGKTDRAVYRDGAWVFEGVSTAENFGLATDIPVPADYTGDGKADIAVFRPSNGTWYIKNMVNGEVSGIQFGANGDRAVPADYDGDGKADVAVYRNGTWYIQQSTAGFKAVAFGVAADRPVPADYDGDRKADVAVYRNGAWYMLESSANDQFRAANYGIASDKPVPADYNGDGKADIAVYRGGVWYILGEAPVHFGVNSDMPIPASMQ